ncbi:MAG: hypothetical protein ACE37F_29535 [Nannocystaceae bacterium]|nr:hypothetical protein [bacterium]
MWRFLLGGAVLGLLGAGCDAQSEAPTEAGDDYLDADVVTSLPEGDGVGNEVSGTYETRATVTSCVGACGPFEAAGTTYLACERDAESVEWVSAYQDDGALRVDLDDDGHVGINVDGYAPVRMHGGVDIDGSWEVGGHDTKFGGDIEATARARGRIRAGVLEGTLEVQVSGVVGGTELDCHATHRLASVEAEE